MFGWIVKGWKWVGNVIGGGGGGFDFGSIGGNAGGKDADSGTLNLKAVGVES